MNSIKIVLFCVFQFVVLFNIVNGATFISAPKTHPDHPGKCWDTESLKAYSVGESYSYPNSCSEVTCRGDFSFQGFTCGVMIIEPPKGCVVVSYEDLTKPYPACCSPVIKCDNANAL